MEQNIDSPAPVAEEKKICSCENGCKCKKGKKGLIITTILMAILAIGGIGFGIFEMTQVSDKDNQISDLKNKPCTKCDVSETNTETEVKTETKTETESTTTNNVTTTTIVGGPYIKNNYFFVPKWGVKFKLSDKLTNYGYAIDQSSQGDSYGNYVVGLSAIMKSDYKKNPQTKYYNDIFSCSVITIRALEDSKKDWWGDVAPNAQFNGYKFIIHDIWREEDCNIDTYFASTAEVAKQLKTILSNPEKI